MKRTTVVWIACAIVLVVAIAAYGQSKPAEPVQTEPVEQAAPEEKAEPEEQPAETAPVVAPNEALASAWQADFDRIAGKAKMDVGVSAIDLTTGATAGYNSGKKMRSASVIKVLIAEAFLKQVSEGKLSLDDTYVVKPEDIVGGAGSLQYRGAGIELTSKQLLWHMIAESDNIATNAIIDMCTMDAINEEAARLGLTQTELRRYMMDFKMAYTGLHNYTSADDLAKLLKMVYDKTFVNEEMSELVLECLEDQTDNECITLGLPEGTVFAHKTGSLDEARNDGGIVEGDKPFVLVVLCGGEGFYESGAIDTMAQLADAAYKDMQIYGWPSYPKAKH